MRPMQVPQDQGMRFRIPGPLRSVKGEKKREREREREADANPSTVQLVATLQSVLVDGI